MIIGLSHLLHSCPDHIPSSLDENLIQRLGYSRKFVETEIPNHPEKSRFMYHPHTAHEISFYSKRDGNGIEFIRYPSATAQQSLSGPYFYVFGGDYSETEFPFNFDEGVKAPLPSLFSFHPGSSFLWSPALPQSAATVIALTADLRGSYDFWTKMFSFQSLDNDPDPSSSLSLVRRSVVPSFSCSLILSKAHMSNRMLDGKGISALAFLCKDIERVRRNLDIYEASAVFEMKFANTLLRIFLCRGPGGELIECFQREQLSEEKPVAKVHRS
jgi:hypothetical protein